MLYRPYGRTGKKISAVSVGGMRFRTPVTRQVVRDSVDMLVRAHGKGVNYFDTAPMYCDDRSEEITGLALREMDPGSWYVSTKCNAPDGAGLRRGLEKSLKRLRVPRIHFFHVWCLLRPGEWDERKRGGVLDAGLRAREEGLIEHLAFSTHMSGEETAKVIAEGVFEGVTLGFSAIDFPYRRRALEAAAEAGIGVVTMNPLGGGIIPRHAARFDFIRRPEDPDVVTAAIRFNLSHPAVTSALVGVDSAEHVDSALAALDGFVPYPAEAVAKIEKHIEESFDGLCTGCGYCLPCPKGVPIPKLMDAYNFLILEKNRHALLDRLKWQWALTTDAATHCDACGQCEGECTQGLPIIQRLKEIGG